MTNAKHNLNDPSAPQNKNRKRPSSKTDYFNG